MAEIRDWPDLMRRVKETNLDTPEVILVSGSDADLIDTVLEGIRHRLQNEVGGFETTVFSGEASDGYRFQEETFNIPLFAPYRLMLVRQADEAFRDVTAAKNDLALLAQNFAALPDRTFVVMQFAGDPGSAFQKAIGPRLLHLHTRELFSNQVVEAIRAAARKHKLQLEEDAIHELRERVEPRHGAIDVAMIRLREALPPEAKNQVTVDHVRDILYPVAGMNNFDFVDALFHLDQRAVEREFTRFFEGSDNLLGLLKLILNRTDEIRRARIGKSLGMNDSDLVQLLGLKSRPPFIQQKILKRLQSESSLFDATLLSRIYNMLIQLQIDFRGVVPKPRQITILQERLQEVFFS